MFALTTDPRAIMQFIRGLIIALRINIEQFLGGKLTSTSTELYIPHMIQSVTFTCSTHLTTGRKQRVVL